MFIITLQQVAILLAFILLGYLFKKINCKWFLPFFNSTDGWMHAVLIGLLGFVLCFFKRTLKFRICCGISQVLNVGNQVKS